MFYFLIFKLQMLSVVVLEYEQCLYGEICLWMIQNKQYQIGAQPG